MLRPAHIRGNELSVFKQITLRLFKARPHESENFWNLRFFSIFVLSPRVNGVYRYKTGSFSKTVPRVEIFENEGFNTFTYGRTKTEVFEYYDVIHHMPLALSTLCKGCYRIVLAFSCGQAKTIEIRYTCTCGSVFFFFEGEKSSLFQNYPDSCGQGLSFYMLIKLIQEVLLNMIAAFIFVCLSW